MLGVERRQRVMEMLTRDGRVYVGKLAETFHVTEETVRRDLEKLEQKKLLHRSYGGAVLAEATSEDLSFVRRSGQNQESKLRIADAAHPLDPRGGHHYGGLQHDLSDAVEPSREEGEHHRHHQFRSADVRFSFE